MLRVGFLTKPFAWIPSGPRHAAYAAALGLVAIQVGIGIVMKLSQSGGTYAFSPSASTTISEFLKMLLSNIFFWRECKSRVAKGEKPSTRGSATGYATLPVDEEEKPENGDAHLDGPQPRMSPRLYWQYFKGEVTVDTRYGFMNLALFYVLINNSIFVSYKLADPGTIQLTKSGVTFITALVMIATLGTKISKIQWMAIIMQICGLMVTQYNPQTGTTYPVATYLILLFQVFLSASSGVYNQALLKSDDSSLHADNMILYAAGTVVNLIVHVTLSFLKADEPSFFEGYNSFGAVMVIVSNVFIGLAITAVYKYADAVIKCFATAVATGILLYVSPILFGTELGFLVVPGTVVVFIASWMYMDNPPPKEAVPAHAQADAPQKPSLFARLGMIQRKYKYSFLGISTFVTVLIVAFLTMSDSRIPDFSKGKEAAESVVDSAAMNTTATTTTTTTMVVTAAPTAAPPTTDTSKAGDLIESPFKNSLAFVRWNGPRPERVPSIMKYEPFFDKIHVSMPKQFPDQAKDFHNITHDQFRGTYTIYLQLAHTMKLILDEHPTIDGIMFFHFDAWIDPLQWTTWDRNNIWFPSVTDLKGRAGPLFICMKTTKRYPHWWGWGGDKPIHKVAKDATAGLVDPEKFGKLGGSKYVVEKGEWCLGWSDIYWIPRRFFADYIFLSEVFGSYSLFHEVAIPTMLHIIDQTRSPGPQHAKQSVISKFGDCWGSCCTEDPTAEDVIWNRCGHKLDYLNEPVASAFYDKLDSQAKLLGGQRNGTAQSGSGWNQEDAAGLKRITPLLKHIHTDEKEYQRAYESGASGLDPEHEKWMEEAAKAKLRRRWELPAGIMAGLGY